MAGVLLSIGRPMEFPEQPDRSEWRVIWVVFALSLLISVDWDPQVPTRQGAFIVFAVIAGALMIWRQQARQPLKSVESQPRNSPAPPSRLP
jgi:hypothetical protein